MRTIKLKKKMIEVKKKTKQLALALFLLCYNFATASGSGVDIDSQIETWGETISDALNAAVGVFAVVGGFIIFIQYMQGNDQAQKNFIKFVIGLAIFALAAAIVNVFLP